MIPLRLTAVAANPDMAVITWVLAKSQVEPENYAVMTIPDDQIVFTAFGSDNYRTLVSQTADRLRGRAFVTGLKRRIRVHERRVAARLTPQERMHLLTLLAKLAGK